MRKVGIADLVNLISDGVSSRSQGLTSDAACKITMYLFVSLALIRYAICHMVSQPE